MDYEKHRYLLAAVRSLREAQSWTGRTHIQKALALASAVLEDKLPFEFVLFKHGPYSFDADRELDRMLTYDAIFAVAQGQYGPSYKLGDGSSFPEQSGEGDESVIKVIRNAALFAGSRNVVELEALATAVWIRKREGIQADDKVRAKLEELKPHLPEDSASNGVRDSRIFLEKMIP